MNYANRRRWSDNDRNFGPFTYSRDKHYRPIALVIQSGDDEYPGAQFRISAFGHTFIVALPSWALRPYKRKVQARWSADDIERIGRDWYWQIDRRQFGFSYSAGHLSLYFGRQSDDRETERHKGFFLPWTQWRHVRHSFYGLDGEHIATLPKGKSYRDDPGLWDREQTISEAAPTWSFVFRDFDGEEITAITKIEEREWRFGTGWFKWLSLFRSPKINRSLDLRFSAEVGKRKGSWKGGTIGHSIDMQAGELHEAAFRRYCVQNGLTYEGPRP